MVNSDSFIYLPTFILSFDFIFVETAADLTLDPAHRGGQAAECDGLCPGNGKIVRSFLMVVNEHLLLW